MKRDFDLYPATRTRSVFIAAAVLLLGTHAQASVSISTAATKNIACTAGVCTPTAPGAVLNVTMLENLLASSNVTISTNGAQASDIVVNAALSWVSGNTLTLDAYRSIAVNKPIADDGAGGLTLYPDDGGTGGALTFGPGGNVSFLSLSDKLTIVSGSYAIPYKLVRTITTLASVIAAKPKGYYALASNYNASADGTYASVPIPTTFSGKFEGLGNSISNLKIVDTSDFSVGLFAMIASGASVRDLALPAASVAGNSSTGPSVGVLTGRNSGNIVNCFAGGTVSSTGSTMNDVTAGGLAGFNLGTIADSEAAARVRVHSTDEVGGLVGGNAGTIENSFATGAVSEIGTTIQPADVGGLIGFNSAGRIIDSYSSGAVSGNAGDSVGGLIGSATGGTFTNAYWDTTTSGTTSSAAGAGLTNTQLQAGLPTGFAPTVWTERTTTNGGLPYLLGLHT